MCCLLYFITPVVKRNSNWPCLLHYADVEKRRVTCGCALYSLCVENKENITCCKKCMGCRLSQKSTLQNHIYRNTFTEFSAHLAISSDDLAKSSDDLAKSSAHLAISSNDLAKSSAHLAISSNNLAISSNDLAKSSAHFSYIIG